MFSDVCEKPKGVLLHMCVHVPVCLYDMCMYACACECSHKCVYVCACMHVCECSPKCVCMCMCVYACACECSHKCVHVYVHVSI